MAKYSLMLLLGLCASCLSVPSDQLFENLDPVEGQKVQVEGFLKFGFEDRNLYPSGNWKEDRRSGRCIPLGVDRDSPVEKIAEHFDGKRVRVHGSVQKLVAQDEINSSLCRDIGVKVDRMELLSN